MRELLKTIEDLIPIYLKDSSIFTVSVTDLEGNYLYVNALFKDRYKFITDDFVGLPFIQTVHPDDIEKCNQAAYQCIIEPTKVVNIRIRKPIYHHTNYFLTNWEFSLLKEADSNPIGILCIGHDISETTRASNIARLYVRRISTVLRNITDAYFVLDTSLRIQTVNKAFERVIGIKKHKAIGMSIWDIINKEQAGAVEAFSLALSKQTPTRFEGYAEQLEKWFLISVYPSPEGLIVLCQDITESKKEEERVKFSELNFRAMMNGKDEIKILMDKNFDIVFFNKVADEFVQKFDDKQLIIGANIFEYMNEVYTKKFKDGLTQALHGTKSEKEQEIRFGDGSVFWFKRTISPVYGIENEVIGIAMYMLNITTQKQTDRKMQKQLEALREVAFIQSHVMRSPVASILGLINLFDRDKLEGENKELMHYLEIATQDLDKVIHKVVAKVNQAEAFE